ncbi:NADH-quinone oxidoreductase subunit C [Streptomyces sp. ME01-24h]|nr:NADH-quinone oxidoreductase subunit C [Streptomyces sp. ME01-24h]
MTTPFDRLPGPDAVAEVFGTEATAEEAYGLLTVDVPAASWTDALRAARDTLGCTFFDWLSAVDEGDAGFRVCAHVVAPAVGSVRRLMIRTTVPHEAPALPTAVGVYAGAAWHERETHEMFGVDFTGHPHLLPLLLPDGFEGYPLRKDFVLAARVAKAWPGAKEPGEPAAGAAHGGPKRRQMLPPGVPDPNEWGPLKGQLPPAPARPARTPRAAGAAGAAGATERPARRTRSVTEGSASQAAPATPTAAPRRTRSVTEGSASQAAPAAPETPRRRTPDAPWDVSRDTTATGPATAEAGPPEAVTAEATPAAQSEKPDVAAAAAPAAAAATHEADQPSGEGAPATPATAVTPATDPAEPSGGSAAAGRRPAADGDRSPAAEAAPAGGAEDEPARPAPADDHADTPHADTPDHAGAPGTADHDDAEGGSTP